jgi:hypothetical protein
MRLMDAGKRTWKVARNKRKEKGQATKHRKEVAINSSQSVQPPCQIFWPFIPAPPSVISRACAKRMKKDIHSFSAVTQITAAPGE